MVKNKTNKNDKRSQKGRSMVEMLATLSIIGVLSVGAVAGFKTAMNKHKANELIQELKMHSVSLAGQALSQNLPENMTLNNIIQAHPRRR